MQRLLRAGVLALQRGKVRLGVLNLPILFDAYGSWPLYNDALLLCPQGSIHGEHQISRGYATTQASPFSEC